MAVNTIRKRNWVGLTYRRLPEFQAWVDRHPEPLILSEVTTAFLGILMAFPEAVQTRFAHPAGRAFDFSCPLWKKEETVEIVRSLHGLELFLDGEGGLPILHCQFREDPVID